MNLQPPDPPGFGSCLKCHTLVDESEQSGGICFECHSADFGKEPAFPIGANDYGGHGTCFGISVRDYFAAKAIQGLSANPSIIDSSDSRAVQYAAEQAYQLADAMLAARAQS